MKRKLNDAQIKFLMYIRDNHRCLGWDSTIPDILRTGEYRTWQMGDILLKWRDMCDGSTHAHLIFGTPKKYLKWKR